MKLLPPGPTCTLSSCASGNHHSTEAANLNINQHHHVTAVLIAMIVSCLLLPGVEVTLIDANHCPGAVQFLFLLPDGTRVIHSGDMRFCEGLMQNPLLEQFRGADMLYLDTTYCNPRYCFPAQVSVLCCCGLCSFVNPNICGV